MKKGFSILFFLISFATFPQEKREVEKRIDKSEMPEKALQLYDSQIPGNIRRERFYFERDSGTESYEAKFKFGKNRYSVAFGKDGKLQDIEVELRKDQIPKPVFENIRDYLEKHTDRYNVEKTQGQFVNTGNPDLVFGNAMDFEKQAFDNYELIVAVKNNGNNERYELLFDHGGNFLQKRKIIRESSSFQLF